MTISKTTTNLSTLKINYLTEEQYQDALENQEINEDEIYMTPGEGNIDATATPTTNKISKFDTNAKMNSTDMTAAQVEDFVENLDVGGGGGNHGIPAGGSNGQILAKNSATDYDVTWVDMPTMTAAVITLPAANWSNGTLTVNAPGVTTSNVILVTPAPASYDDYVINNVRCTAQGTGTLTFSNDFTPGTDIAVNIFIVNAVTVVPSAT